jgi:very-short-patch-repair endonuclease
MDRKYNKDLLPFAKELRRNMTAEERHLWFDFLRTYPVKFTRQKILGRYIADFCCPQAKLVIELDGSQHYEDNEIEKDSERTKYLEQYGLKVIRIPNNEVKQNFQSVCEYIDIAVKKRIEKINDSGQ